MATQQKPYATTSSGKPDFSRAERAMQPEVHGFLNALTSLPGMRLRKLGDVPDVTDPKTGQVVRPGQSGDLVWDFYSPLGEQPRPDEYSGLADQLSYEGGEGRGGLVNAGLLVPAAVRGVGRMALEALRGRQATRAGEALAQEVKRAGDAAEWMSPREVPGGSGAGPAMLGEEAAQVANQAPSRIRAAEDALLASGKALQAAPNLGANSAVDDLLQAMVVGKPLAAGASTLLNESAGSVDKDLKTALPTTTGDQFVNVPEPSMGQVTDMSGQLEQPRQSAAERLQQALAGNKGISRYQAPRKNLVQRASDYINPRQAHERDLRNEEQFYKNEALRQLDPQTQFMLSQLAADLAAEREIDTKRQLKTPGQEFGLRFGPAMEPTSLESLYDLPAGSINEESLRRMGAEKKLDPIDLLMMQLLGNMGNFGPASQGRLANEPILNVPANR